MPYRLLHTRLNSRVRRLLGALMPTIFVSLLALPAQAQPASRIAAPDPLDAKAKVPALVYESALAGYLRMAEVKPTPWREANDTVTRIGGWRAYTREAQQPETPPPAPTPSPSRATPTAPTSPHAGHRAP